MAAHRSNFLFLVVGVDGHSCYGRATRVISETDFARQFATLLVGYFFRFIEVTFQVNDPLRFMEVTVRFIKVSFQVYDISGL